MKITINGQDYTSALDAAHPLTITRSLNAPSTCQLWLSLAANCGIATPSRNQSISITTDDGTCYFTGYIAASPLPEYAGQGMEGPRYRIAIQAVSDELLLDQLSLAPSRGATGTAAGDLLASLVTKSGSSGLSTESLTLDAPIGNFVPSPGATWSASAGRVANHARATYRVLNRAVTLATMPAAVHALNETDGSLTLANLALTTGARRALANDITVCGAHEPVAYATEYFLGDGVTTQFNLSADPYITPFSKSVIIRELFNETEIDPRIWGNPGGYGYLSLGGGGLVMRGGNGIDGDTQLTWRDPIEMGGTLLLEATGVTLAPGSTGTIAGFFVGLETQPACTAGFRVAAQQGTGAVSLQPVVQGMPTGAIYAVNSARQYTLRIRVHSPECQRVAAIYRSFGDDGPVTYGGQWNVASAKLQFEVQESVNGVAGMPVTLVRRINREPARRVHDCRSQQHQSLRNHAVVDPCKSCSAWVVSTPVNGDPRTRRLGSVAQAAECQLDSSGRLVFNNGFAPPVGELIAVSYRTVGRALGRAVKRTKPAGAGTVRPACCFDMDRLRHQSSGAHLAGLPQCRPRDGEGRSQRQRTMERHLQGDSRKFRLRCLARRCITAAGTLD